MTRLLKGYFKQDLWEAISGDLLELYQEEASRLGTTTANRRYLFNALAFLRYQRLRHYSKTQNHMDLLKNYILVSWRDIRHHYIFSSINLLGLVSGFTIMLVVLQYVLYETSFDSFHEKHDQIYRVINNRYQNGTLVQRGPITYPTIGPTLANEFPEVEGYSRIRSGGRNYLKRADDQHLLDDYIWADANFLELFSFPVLVGNGATALDEPASVVLTKTYAERLLQEGESIEDLVGTQVTINNWEFLSTITAIIKDVPAKSHLQFEALISYETFIRLAGEAADNSGQWSDFNHYVLLNPTTDPHQFEGKLDGFSSKYFKEGEVSGAVEKFELQPLDQIHLDNTLEYEYAMVADPDFIYFMGFIALIILSIAWINYINLTTSRATQRAREVGIRKVLGAYRQQIMGQFLTESFLFNGAAILLSIVIVVMSQPLINQWTRLPLTMEVVWSSQVFALPFPIAFMLLFVFIIFLVGIYPAMMLSRYKPKEIIKGRYQTVGAFVHLRKLLVIIQFAAALVLISGSIAIYRQISFMLDQDLGMNMENNLVVFGPELQDFDSTFIDHFEEFRTSLLSIPGIVQVTSQGRMFGTTMARSFQIRDINDPEEKEYTGNWMGVDYRFAQQFDISVLNGRFFDGGDHHFEGRKVNTAVVNKAAAQKIFGTTSDALGQKISLGDNNRSYRIVGVLDNFHQRSLKQSIEPIILFPFYDNYHYIVIKYANGNEQQAIANAERLYNEFYPGNYFDYLFMEDQYQHQYQSDQRIGNMAAMLSAIAILLAILGLYGLVLITFMKKHKEIGIRKVLGASMPILLKLYGSQFIGILIIAMTVGFPLSYWIIDLFLQDYAFHVGVEWWTIVFSGILMLSLCLITILTQINKIASNNPVDSLRYE